MTWHSWFLKGFFVVAKCHDIHSGYSTSSSFQWNILFFENFLRFWKLFLYAIRLSLDLQKVSISLQQTCESIENTWNYVLNKKSKTINKNSLIPKSSNLSCQNMFLSDLRKQVSTTIIKFWEYSKFIYNL